MQRRYTGNCSRWKWNGTIDSTSRFARLNGLTAEALKPHQEAVAPFGRSAWFGVDSPQKVIAEVGVQAKTCSSATQLTSWVGTRRGKEEGTEENHSGRSRSPESR